MGWRRDMRSTERYSLPDGTVWKDRAWGLTAEPVVFAYNRRLHPELQAIRSHQDLITWLERNPPPGAARRDCHV
jgi:iron(III) transport system substrate-binding protein